MACINESDQHFSGVCKDEDGRGELWEYKTKNMLHETQKC